MTTALYLYDLTGCFCPPGLVELNDTCVRPQFCPTRKFLCSHVQCTTEDNHTTFLIEQLIWLETVNNVSDWFVDMLTSSTL